MASGQHRFPLVLARELLKRLQVKPGEPLAFGRQPLVVAALQQLAGVQLDRLLEQPLGQRPLELLGVQPHRCIRPPLQRPRPDVDQPVSAGQRSAQDVPYLAQVRVGLSLGRPGPQQER